MIIDSNQIAENIKKELKQKLLSLKKPPILAIIYIGKNPASESFITRKKKYGEDIGVQVSLNSFPEEISPEELKEEISTIANSSDGMIIQLPLPSHLNTQEILNCVPTEKDVDILSNESEALYAKGKLQNIPPVAGAIEEICTRNNISLADKNILIIGNGRLVGKPVSVWLKKLGIHPIIIDENTKGTDSSLQQADVVISGVGIPHLIKAKSLKDGVIIFDAGTSFKDGKLAGDFEPECANKASFFTPVPGGIGPITVAILFKNLFLSSISNTR